MKIKFLADVNLDRGIIQGVLRRESLIDFQTANDAGLTAKSDLEVLEIAATRERLLVTHDRKTMPGAFGAFIRGRRSFGVLLISQSPPLRIAIDELVLIWSASDAEEWTNVISPIPL